MDAGADGETGENPAGGASIIVIATGEKAEEAARWKH